MSKLGIQDLATVLSQKRGLTKAQAEKFVGSLFDVVSYGLDTDRLVKIKGFGTFKITNVKDRESINVNTGERVVINGHGKISFTPENVLRDMVNKPFSQFETVVLNDGVDFSQMDEETTAQDDEPASEVVADIPNSTTSENVLEHEDIHEEPSIEPALPIEEVLSATIVDIVAEETEEKLPNEHESDSSDKQNASIEQEADISEEQETDASNENEIEEDHVSPSQNVWKPILIGFAFVVFAALVGAGGYYMGAQSSSESSEHRPIAAAADTSTQAKKAISKPVTKEATDTITPTVNVGVSTTADDDARKAHKKEVEAKEPLKETVKEETSKQEEKATTKVEDLSSKYDKMDARVRTGAYAIVGVSRVVTAKQGETIQRISDRNLGPGMECYVEVLNGKRDIKVGDQIKIPELRLKKRMKNK